MLIKNKIAPCSCCGQNTEIYYGIDNYDSKIYDLNNYLKFKDIYVYRCYNCGMVSVDISKENNFLYDDVKNSNEFINAYNYRYLLGFNDMLYENHSESVPANIYDAYTIMLKHSDNLELYLRTLNKTIELKQVMLRKYDKDVAEEGDQEEDLEIFNQLKDLMNKNIRSQQEEFIQSFKKLKNKSIFLYLTYIENLTYINKKEAMIQFNKLASSVKLNDDLIEYIQMKF